LPISTCICYYLLRQSVAGLSNAPYCGCSHRILSHGPAILRWSASVRLCSEFVAPFTRRCGCAGALPAYSTRARLRTDCRDLYRRYVQRALTYLRTACRDDWCLGLSSCLRRRAVCHLQHIPASRRGRCIYGRFGSVTFCCSNASIHAVKRFSVGSSAGLPVRAGRTYLRTLLFATPRGSALFSRATHGATIPWFTPPPRTCLPPCLRSAVTHAPRCAPSVCSLFLHAAVNGSGLYLSPAYHYPTPRTRTFASCCLPVRTPAAGCPGWLYAVPGTARVLVDGLRTLPPHYPAVSLPGDIGTGSGLESFGFHLTGSHSSSLLRFATTAFACPLPERQLRWFAAALPLLHHLQQRFLCACLCRCSPYIYYFCSGSVLFAFWVLVAWVRLGFSALNNFAVVW